METKNLEILKNFTEDSLPDLDVVVLGALELFSETELPKIQIPYTRPLVAGSEGAGVTARMLFGENDVVFASENDYQKKIENFSNIDGAVVLSSSGGKHAPTIAKYAKEKGKPVTLITNSPVAPAREYADEIIVFPKNREPYSYNTSTYLGMILSQTNENAQDVLSFIEQNIAAVVPDNLSKFEAYCLIIPPQLYYARKMFETKHSELFGPKILGRVFTSEEIKHAKTIVPSESELFISFGEENTLWGTEERRLHIQLPENAGYGALMAIGYYVIGKIQAAHPPYFKENIAAYLEKTAKVFDQKISSIVE